MRQYNKSLNKSSRAFREHIAPILKQKWSLDRIKPCEGTESPEAQNFMQCAERYGKTHLNADLNQTQMIALLSLPDEEETEKFIAEKAADEDEPTPKKMQKI